MPHPLDLCKHPEHSAEDAAMCVPANLYRMERMLKQEILEQLEVGGPQHFPS